MDVSAFNSQAAGKEVVLGAIAQSIWASGFKRSQERSIQVSRPIGAATPNLFDRITRMENFQFAAGRSFDSLGDSLINLAIWPDQVPALANLRFSQGGQFVWLLNCGIQRVELVEKSGALVVFGYTVIDGTWSKSKLT